MKMSTQRIRLKLEQFHDALSVRKVRDLVSADIRFCGAFGEKKKNYLDIFLIDYRSKIITMS